MDATLTTKYDKALELALLSLLGENITGPEFDMEAYNRAVKAARVINEPAVLDAVKYVDSCASRAGYIVGIDAPGGGELYLDIVWNDENVSASDIQAFLDSRSISSDAEDEAERGEEEVKDDEAKAGKGEKADGKDEDQKDKHEGEETNKDEKAEDENDEKGDDPAGTPELSIDHIAVAEPGTIMSQSVRTFLAKGTFPSNAPVEISIGHGNHYSLDNFYVDQKAAIVNVSAL